MVILGLDIGSNSIGSAWIDTRSSQFTTGTSIFPAGVEESDEKRGDPKNAKRRGVRRTRITLMRRAERKRQLRDLLRCRGLLPPGADEFKKLLEQTDPWALRQEGLDRPLTPHEFGRVLLHLAQRRGAMGLKITDGMLPEDAADGGDDGKVTASIKKVRTAMRAMKARTFGELIAMRRAERVHPISTPDHRAERCRNGAREYCDAVRNKSASYEHCADRQMIRDEFAALWDAQERGDGPLARQLRNDLDLRRLLDDESGDSTWRHKGLLFGQRRASWDLGTLGRCVLEPTERCAPHADMDASRFLVVETVNNLKIIERGKEPRSLSGDERAKVKAYLSGPLGLQKTGKHRGQPKRSVTVQDLRDLMGWGRATKTSPFRFNIEADEDRVINTDWFSREIIHGAIGPDHWSALPQSTREGLNRALLKYDPDEPKDAEKCKAGLLKWAELGDAQADTVLAAWRKRPRPDAKRLNLSRRAARNLLTLMDRDEPWPDPKRPGETRWLTPIEARKLIAQDADIKDVTTGALLSEHARRRYSTGAKGATARDRHYMKKHLLTQNGAPIFGPDGLPLHEPAPAPLIANPVVRKAIHEVRRHLIEYMKHFGRKPDQVYIELAREARMGKKDADEALFRNRLRNRIRNEIAADPTLDLGSRSSTQQRAAVDRVILCVQQDNTCPLCGQKGLTPRSAALGEDCEVAHIVPSACGGHNGLGNIVLAHTKCNREMGRRTPRQYWEQTLDGGFEAGMAWLEQMYGAIDRPRASEVKTATGLPLWSCFFNHRDDAAKVQRFKKAVTDIAGMTERQEAATKYASRQVMAYLADALFDGNGLPERGGERRIYATDGMWTSRFRREWGLSFDPHHAKSHGLAGHEEQARREKNRGDHRHHAIDAIVVAFSSQEMRNLWDARERQADVDGFNTASEEAMEAYRRLHRLPPPPPFKDREEFREAVRRAVFGGKLEHPICHRPVKRKLVGSFHEEWLFGPVLDRAGKLTDKFTARPPTGILAIDPNHLRLPRPETTAEAIDRLAERRRRLYCADERAARKWARAAVASRGYHPAIVDPPPGKSGIVRDLGLRLRLRQCLIDAGLDPDHFSTAELNKLVKDGGIRHASGVPIRSAVLLRTMSDPVIVSRWAIDHETGNRRKVFDALTGEGDARAARAFVAGNNHHIEIRTGADKSGRPVWTGEVVTAFAAAQRNVARLRALNAAAIPKPRVLRNLAPEERKKLAPQIRRVEAAFPIVDRRDDDAKGGQFVMSLCEGETLFMRHKQTGEVGYFVVAKLDRPQRIVLVPHWDARAATERKDAEGNRVANSRREQFDVTPTDLATLAPPGHLHAVKVRVSVLGDAKPLIRD